jgi:hypothetical protein
VDYVKRLNSPLAIPDHTFVVPDAYETPNYDSVVPDAYETPNYDSVIPDQAP